MRHPYFLHRKTLMQHLMLHGATGSGKTSLILIPLFEQLLNIAAMNKDSSVIILDLKGDAVFFHSLRIRARKLGLPFRWFTTKRLHSSYGFNPFRQKHFQSDITRNQAAEMFAKSFGLDFGQVYGASYFRDMAVLVLRALLELPEIDSFAKLSQYIKEHPNFFQLPKKTAEQTTHLHAALDALATIEPLNVTPETSEELVVSNSIDIGDVHDEPQVLYFYLPSALEDLICFTVAKLVGYLLLTSAAIRIPRDRKKVFLGIDEFQRIVSQDFTLFVQQARAYEIGCILASQTTSDLYAAGTDFADILEENTGTKIDLTGMGHRQAIRLMEQSPEGIRRLKTTGENSVSYREEVLSSLTYDDLVTTTAKTGEGLIRTAMPYGLTQCGGRQVRFKADFHLTSEEYDRRFNLPLPNSADHPGTISIDGNQLPTAKDKPATKVAQPKLDNPMTELLPKPREFPLPAADSPFQTLAAQILRNASQS